MPGVAATQPSATSLSGLRVLVVGFATPAGREIARACAEAGAGVAAASASLDGDEVMEAKRAAKDVAKLGRASASQGWDVTLPMNVQVSLKQLTKEFGRPSVLVYNADAPFRRPIEKTTDAEFAHIQQVNLHGAFSAARSFLREHPQGEPGRIIFVAPLTAEGGLEQASAYAAAKAGVIGLTQALAEEASPRGVTVNCITSGLLAWGPAGRTASGFPAGIAGAEATLGAVVVALAAEAGAQWNGQIIVLDGDVSEQR